MSKIYQLFREFVATVFYFRYHTKHRHLRQLRAVICYRRSYNFREAWNNIGGRSPAAVDAPRAPLHTKQMTEPHSMHPFN